MIKTLELLKFDLLMIAGSSLAAVMFRFGFGIRGFKLDGAFLRLLAAVGLFGLSIGIGSLLLHVPDNFASAFRMYGYVPMLFYMIITGVPAEELLFRQVIWKSLERAIRAPCLIVLLSAVIFGGYHMLFFDKSDFFTLRVLQVPNTILLGLALGYSRLRYNSILAPILLHGLYNITSDISVWIGRY